MTIKSSPFGVTCITGSDADLFLKQVNNPNIEQLARAKHALARARNNLNRGDSAQDYTVHNREELAEILRNQKNAKS